MPYIITTTKLFERPTKLYIAPSRQTIDNIKDVLVSFVDKTLADEYGPIALRLLDDRLETYDNPSPTHEVERRLAEILQQEHEKLDLWSPERLE